MKRTKKRRAVLNFVSERTVVSEGWIPVFDGLAAGISFDHAGMHVVKVWPDGEPTYELIAWNDVSPSMVIDLHSPMFEWVDVVFINDEPVRLTASQRKSKQAMVNAIFGLPEQFPLRVHLGTNDSTKMVRAGKARSIEAASFGFLRKLAWLRRLHRRMCKRF